MLRLTLAITAFTLAAGIAYADPVELTPTEMDSVTAGGLLLPNGKEVFVELDNPAPGDSHPSFSRPRASNANQVGPWKAHEKSPVIGFIPPT